MAVEIDGRLCALGDDERVAVQRDERGRGHRPHKLPHRGAQCSVTAGQRISELAFDPLRAESLGAGDAGGVEHECGCPRAASWAMPRSGSGSATALELGSDDQIGVARLEPAGIADGLLALGVGPAGAEGDQIAVVTDEQSADDLAGARSAGRRLAG